MGHPAAGRPIDGDVALDADGRLEALYRREHAGMVDVAHLLLGDAGRAEEVVHDAFLRVAPHLDDLEHPRAYLRTTVVNLCQDHHRRAGRARRHPTESEGIAPAPAIPVSSTVVWQALQRLPERQRSAVVLRYVADLSTEDIAEALSIRPATVRSLVHRGLAALKEVVPRD